VAGKCEIKHWFFRWGWIIAAALGGMILLTIAFDFISKRVKKRKTYQTSNQDNPYESDIAL
jgi:small neutral amino acid transporter SnatA (MarC family)